MSAHEVNTADTETPIQKSASLCGWFSSSWFVFSLGGMILLVVCTGLLTGAPASYVLGQLVLGLSVYFSLAFLADRPLVNPIQAVVATFYWWFGVGPVVVALWNLLLGMPEAALKAQESSMEALWIVAPGLLLYAITARITIKLFSDFNVHARFLLPAGENYRPKVLVIYFSMAMLSTLLLVVLQRLGIQGQEQTTLLGGTKTTIWWVGVIAAAGAIAPFVKSSLMIHLASPWKKIPFIVQILIVVTILQTLQSAVFGGWKSPVAFLGAFYVCAYVSRWQRPPWLIIFGGAALFVFIIAPFVTYGRILAQSLGAETTKEREQILGEVLKDSTAFLPSGAKSLDVAVFFRGIYPLAGELTRRNGYFEGEWHGETITWGLETVVPRVFMPDKRDSNMGNLFARTVGADIGVSEESDFVNNVAVSIPFEFLGNYGRLAGLLSFVLIGIFWPMLSVWMLSPARLSDHPLTPFMVLSTMALEAPLGAFLTIVRGLVVPLLLVFVVHRLLRGKV